jgi:cell division protein FtsN
MARDYSKRPHKRNTRKSSGKNGRTASIRPWTWLLTGLLGGLVIAAVAYLKISFFASEQTAAPAGQAKSKAQTAVAKAAAGPKFDFYTLLPEMEVAVAKKPASAIAATPSQTPALPEGEIVLPSPFEQAKYRLQLASFKRYDEADMLKAKLAMAGHIVEIHSIKLDNGLTWYRVYTPIVDSREKALNLQKELKAQAISSMLLKAS